MIRYFTHTTKGTCNRLFPRCRCGAENDQRHGADVCQATLPDRDAVIKKFDRLYASAGLTKKKNVFDYLHDVFFCIVNVENKTRKALIELMKSTIVRIIINDTSIDKRELDRIGGGREAPEPEVEPSEAFGDVSLHDN